MKNNKALMCLFSASISALAASPAISAELTGDKSLIDSNIFDINNLTPEQLDSRNQVMNEVDVFLTRKAPLMKLGESVSLMIDSYGTNNLSLKNKVYKNLGFGAASDKQKDSSMWDTSTSGQTAPMDPCANVSEGSDLCPAVCYIPVCHSACHGACHGARGWR